MNRRGKFMNTSVVFLTIDFPPSTGGMARQCYDAALALQKSGKDVIVLAPDRPGAGGFDAGSGLAVVRLKGIPHARHFDCYWRSVFIFFAQCARFILKRRAGYICANTWSIAGVAALLAGKLTGVRYAVFAHGLDVAAVGKRGRAARLMRMVLGNARVVIAISGYTRDLVRGVSPGITAVVAHPVVDTARFTRVVSPNPKALEHKRVILSVGRLIPRKNHQAVIRVLPLVAGAIPDVVYRIVGGGPMEGELRALASALGVSGRVVFEGNVPDEELPLYYYSCDVFTLPSRDIPEQGDVEGFGIVFLEAAACARPVVASRNGGIPDAVVDGATGILVDPDDRAALADAFVRILSDPVLARRMGENGRKRVEEGFSLETLGRKFEEIIHAA